MKNTKKFFNLISLFVLFSSNIFSPLSYAIADSDSLGDLVPEEEILENMAEDSHESDDGEDFNENEDFSLEDVNINNDNKIDEDSQSQEEIGDNNIDNEKEGNEKTENKTKDGKDFSGTEGTTTDQIFDKDNTIEDAVEDTTKNTAEDTTKDTTKDTAENIIESYQSEEEIGQDGNNEKENNPEELANIKDEKSEIDLAWEHLNEDLIVGVGKFDGVTVSVEAPVSTFPEYTKLKIIPLSGIDLDEVKQKILGLNSKVLEDSLVAFDIQFVYELSDGSEIKLQPNGNKVEVRFNFSENEDFKDSDIKELKIYHIEDKQNEGEEVVVKKAKLRSSVKSEMGIQELIASKKDDSLVVDATNFSIYAIIKTNIEESVVVNYNAGDGEFEGGINSLTVTYTLNNGEYVADRATKIPHKNNYSFKGWYTSNTCSNRWNGVIEDTNDSEFSVYACYLPFSDKILSYGGASFTMMDRNLGAENIGDYGYLYQWGNNYGFDIGETPAISLDLVPTNTYDGQPRGPDNYYSSSNFISRTTAPFRWDSEDNRNMWGGTSSNQEDWQGPCPDGYHVPNSLEWKAVYTSYIKSGYLAKNFGTTLGLPLAGYRDTKTAGSEQGQGEAGRYWASNAYDGDDAYALIFTDSSVDATDNKYRSYASSVRCFKNTEKVTITFNSNGGSDVDSQSFYRYEPRLKILQPEDPTKDDINFAGWYKNPELTQKFTFTGDTYLSEDITLYAKWGCEDGYILNASNQCVLRQVRVNYMIGDDLYKTVVYARNTAGHYLPTTTSFSTPTKEGNWMFDQWYLDQEFTQIWKFPMDNDGLGEEVTVYGNFLPFEEKVIDFGTLQLKFMDRNMGAKSISTGYNDVNTDNIGYYYQYGNNYGFPNTGEWDNVTSKKVTNPISTAWSYNNPYSNGLFVKVSPWSTNSYTITWGGYSPNVNPESYKQGPCPSGYHIPEKNEWTKIYDTIIGNKSQFEECEDVSNQVCFTKVLGLPLGGYRSSNTSMPTNWGSTSYYAASTYSSYFQGYILQISDSSNSYPSWGGVNAATVRCFKNTNRYVVSFDTQGGTKIDPKYIFRWQPYTNPSTPSRYGSVFSGWYLSTGYTEQFTGYVDRSMTVYAKWDCKEGFIMTTDGKCVTDKRIFVTFKANPETFPGGKFSDLTTEKTIEYKGMPEGYFATLGEEIQVPQLTSNGDTGYMFEGWYVDTSYSSSSRWTGLSLNTDYDAITLYARYLPFMDKTINMNGESFTIMDRNLGATNYVSGYSYEESPLSTRGNYYQYGNNFGFPSNGTYTNNILNVLVENQSNIPWGVGNHYFNGTFIRRNTSPVYWNKGGNNLWLGSDGDRQGPCPDGYHIPYYSEWNAAITLFKNWMLSEEGSSYCNSIHSSNRGFQFCMPAALGLPFAGYRVRTTSNLSSRGTYGYYRSASFSSTSPYKFTINSSNATTSTDYSSNGFSLRCFKDVSYITLNFDSNGGSNVASQTNFVWWQARSTKPANPTRAHSSFVGWFADENLTKSFDFSSSNYITKDTTVYAKWNCDDGYSTSEDGQRCEGASVVTFNAEENGGIASRPVTNFSSGDTVNLENYTATKPGWEFVGWNTDQTAKEAMENFVIGNEGMRIYAIFKKELTATFKRNGNDSQTYSGNTTTEDIVAKCTIRNNETSCDVVSPIITSTTTQKILGYSDSETNHEGMYAVNSIISLSDNIILYAQTMRDSIDRMITFNPNGNASFTYSGDTQTSATDYKFCTIPATYNGNTQNECSGTIIFPDITPNGEKIVLGWSTGANNVDNIISTGSVQTLTANKNLVYYAQSQSDGKTFTVTFYGNGASVSGGNSWQESCTIDGVFNEGVPATECDVNVPNITREGFTILGFNFDENAQSVVYSTGINKLTVSSDKTLYVISKKEVSTKFYKNGNDSQTKYGQSEVDTSDFVIENCTIRNNATYCDIFTPQIFSEKTPTILGYSLGVNNHDVVVNQNSSLSVSNDMEYYAQSKKGPRNIYISFYLNGNESYIYDSIEYTADSTHELCSIDTVYNGVQQPSTCSIDIDFPIISAPNNTPTILGWSTGNTNHIAQYENGESVTINAGENQHFFAQTIKEEIPLTGIFNMGTGIESIDYITRGCTIPAIYNGNNGQTQNTSCLINFPSFTLKTGYQNPIWQSTLGDQNANIITSLPITDNIIFTLVANPISYSITYDKQGGSLVNEKTSYTVEDDDFILKIPTKKGYDFGGWVGSNGYNPQISVMVTKGTVGNLNYSANWNIHTYSIEYHLDGGIIDSLHPNPESYTVESGDITLTNPTKIGYIFDGWTGSNGDVPSKNVVIHKGVNAKDLEYFANYSKKPYVVSLTYEPSTGGSVLGSGTYEYGDEITVSANPGLGYHFLEWKDGEGNTITTNNPYVFTADETGGTGLKAIFDLNEYEVTVLSSDENKGTVGDISGTYKYGKRITLTATPKQGYKFDKWIKNGDVVGTDTTIDVEITDTTFITGSFISRDDTPYTINYVAQNLYDNDYSIIKETLNLSGTTDTLTIIPEKTFDGFVLTGNLNDYQTQILPDGSTVVNVNYDRIRYTITYDPDNGEDVVSFQAKYEKPLNKPADPIKTGYKFVGWYPDFPDIMPLNGTSVVAKYIPKTDTSYRVEYYYQLDDGNYPITATSGDNRLGTTDEVVNVTDIDKISSLQGYVFAEGYPNNVLTGTVLSNGELVLKVYFKKQFTVTYKKGDKGIFEDDIHDGLDYNSDTPEFAGNLNHEEGYIFKSWNPTVTSKVTSNATYTAVWAKDSNNDGIDDEIQDKYKIIVNYIYSNGNIAAESVSGEYLSGINYSFESPIIEHYTADKLIVSGITTGMAEFIVVYNPDKYEIKFLNYDGSVLETSMIDYGTMPIYNGDTPTKDGYIFLGWNPELSTVTGDEIYIATFKENSNGYSGGRKDKENPDNPPDDGEEENNENNNSNPTIRSDNKQNYSQEVIDAYIWARENNITTMDTLDEAMPDKYIIRGHLAKKAVNFAVNVLGKEIPSEIPAKCSRGDDESVWESKEIKDYAEKSCALGIMGIKVRNFDPNKIVSRAEFGTVLSRLLWGDKYDVENPTSKNLYYVKHLQALKDNDIMRDIENPLRRKELRERIRVMLRRVKKII